MKIVIEKEEWQLLGQLALQVRNGIFPKGYSLHACILWEFYQGHASAFVQPQRRKRKLHTSTVFAIYQILKVQPWSYDAYWDLVLDQLREKLYKYILGTNLL
ncbi:MAG: hypothetical protein EPGJADBJ_04456 [Saprospiraceae bacterium]|nr:hypothetical protein [Saprospiraceae bacterium]